jgi:hypothetical protein
MKCIAKDRNNNNCRNKSIDETQFCKLHSYMCNYTEEMISNIKLCSGCKKMYYFENENKVCENCKNRGIENRKKRKENRILCKNNDCEYKKSSENDYCKLHQICLLEDEAKLENKKLCTNYIRGCRTKLEEIYTFSKCEECLKNDREIDNQKRKQVKIMNTLINQINQMVKYCTTCCKEYELNMFEGVKTQTTTCKMCREQNKIQDSKRNRENRNKLARKRVFVNYTKWAKDRNIEFSISREIFENIIKMKCFYCGVLPDDEFNGIDRVDNNIGYIHNNCVSCCKMCNYLKANYIKDVFLCKIEHILKYNGKIEKGRLYPELFVNHNTISFYSYKKGALNRRIEFKISKNEFNSITANNCYICAKMPSLLHKNGIDRYDNNIGYILENCKSCCGDCNWLKNKHNYEELFNKMIMIYNHSILK